MRPRAIPRLTKTHAKFVTLSAGDWRITIRSSGNYNQSPRLENIDIDDDAEIYGFFRGIVDEIVERVPPGIDVPAVELHSAWRALWPMGGDAPGDDVPDSGPDGDSDWSGWFSRNAVPRPAPAVRKGRAR